jgi:hypothetical protein
MAINVFPIPSSAAVTPTGWTAGVAGTFDLSSTLAAGTYLIKTDTTQTMTITLKSATGHNFTGTIRGGSGFISLPIAATQITIPGSLTYPFAVEITPISVTQLAAPTSGALSLGTSGVMTGTWGTVPTGAVSAHLLTTTGAILDFSSTTSGATVTVTEANTTPNAVNNFVIAFKNSSGAYGTGAIVSYTMPASPYPFLSEYLVVGAGGSTGGTVSRSGGGGGAVKTSTTLSNTSLSSFTVTVAATPAVNTSGGSSTFAYGSTTITATGGAAGVSGSSNGATGSSGSGGRSEGSTTTYSGGTGNDGGNGGISQSPNTTYASEGGGGGAGGSASGWSSGNGIASSITGTSTYYAGGGAGGQYSSSGSTGLGGTGRSGSGAANTGAGAGAGGNFGGTGDKLGGSGVVIYAYPSTAPALTTIPGTLTYTVDTTTRAGYRVYKFTAGSGTVTI